MSKQSRAWSATGLGRGIDPELRKRLKEAFAAGWDARGVSESQKQAELARTLEAARDEAHKAIAFLELCRADPTSWETGGCKDALDWLEDIVRRQAQIEAVKEKGHE